MTGQHFATAHFTGVFDYEGRLAGETFDRLVAWCARAKASDINIQSNQQVVAEIAGRNVRVTRRIVSPADVEEICRYVYGDNGPGQIKGGYDMDPSYEVRGEMGTVRFRVNMTAMRSGKTDGIQITMRVLPAEPVPIADLGIEDDIVRNFRPSNGMFLVTGPTGSGKSTLLSSGIRMLLEREGSNEKIIEYSRPIEYVYDAVNTRDSMIFQHEVGRHLRPRGGDGTEESEFAYCVRNALRRKPSIIMIGEARDKATIEASVEAALTGHLLYTTTHSIGVAETLRRLVRPFPLDQQRGIAVDLMEAMRGVVTQYLRPRIGGGRVGMREYMIFDEDVRADLLKREVDEWGPRIRQMFESASVVCKSMKQSAIELHDKGLIAAADRDHAVMRMEREAA